MQDSMAVGAIVPATPRSLAKISWSTTLALGIGRSVEVIKQLAFELFLLFYYVQVLGISSTLAGFAILGSLCASALIDPWVGGLSDRLAGARFGRRHTLMFAAILPATASFYFLFHPPVMLDRSYGTAAWLCTFAVLSRSLFEFFIGPHATQIVDFTRSSSERSSLITVMNLCSYAMSFLAMQIAFAYCFASSSAFPTGQLDPAAYPVFAMVFAGLLCLIMIVSSAGTLRHALKVEQERPNAPLSTAARRLRMFDAWRRLILGDRNVRAVFLGIATFSGMLGLARILNLHVGGYLFGLSTEQVKEWNQVQVVGALITILFARPFVARFEVKTIYVGATAFVGVCHALPPLLHSLGMGHDLDPHSLFHIFLATNFIGGLAAGLAAVSALVLTSSVADEHEYRLGRAEHALLFGFFGLAAKIGSGIGSMLAGLLLDLIHFPRGTGTAVIDPSVLTRLGISVGLTLLAAVLAGVLAFRPLALSNARHREIVTALEQR
jgi:Na+/melibiose symporter-like transporter